MVGLAGPIGSASEGPPVNVLVRCTAASLTAVVLALALVACGDDETDELDPTADAQVVTDPSERVEAEVGDEFVVVLRENLSSGFRWELAAEPDPTVLRLVLDEYEASETDAVGDGGRRYLRLRAVGDGITTLRLRHVRPWEEPPAPIDEVDVDVDVEAADD